jgi:GNAT superfamily N-acetyltransferase
LRAASIEAAGKAAFVIHYYRLQASILYADQRFDKGPIPMITVEKADPFSPESCGLIESLSAELAAITGDSGKSHFTVDAMDGERTLWVLARNMRGDAVGCGAIRPLTQDIAELKRMYSDRSARGIGHALLALLETSAKGMGYRELWLETRRVNQRAVRFYEKNGYARIENYGPYIGREEAVCFSKVLAAGRAEVGLQAARP